MSKSLWLSLALLGLALALAGCNPSAAVPTQPPVSPASSSALPQKSPVAPGATATPQPPAATLASTAQPTDAVPALLCLDRAPAAPLALADIVRTWRWTFAIDHTGGRDYEAPLIGNLTLENTMTWRGSRETDMGTGNNPIAYGPGTFTFDGRTLKLTYDDGSAPETYSGVRIGNHDQGDGTTLQALTLEVPYEGGCIEYLLQEPAP